MLSCIVEELGLDNFDVKRVTSADDERVAFFRMKKVRNHFVYSQLKKEMNDLKEKWISAVSYDVVKRAISGLYSIKAILTTVPVLRKLTPLIISNPDAINGTIYVADEDLFVQIVGQNSNQCQKVVALVILPAQMDISQISPASPCVIFDDVRSADNIGSILRTTFSFGIVNVICTQTSFSSIEARSARVSVGALFHQNVYVTDDLSVALKQLSTNFYILGTSPQASKALSSVKHLTKQWALILGNEKSGSTAMTLETCDEFIYIEQLKGDSLSVVAAASICIYWLATCRS